MDNSKSVDMSDVAQKILSCIFRLQEKFGVEYVARVLCGSHSRKIIENKHDKLSTYGIVGDYSRAQLRVIIQNLFEHGFVTLTKSRYPILQLNQKSIDILKGRVPIFLTPPPDDFSLWLHDKKTKKIEFERNSIELFRQGKTIEEIARLRKISKAFVVEHFETALIQGQLLNLNSIIPSEKQKIIRDAFSSLSVCKLSPVKQLLGDSYLYDELRLIRAQLLGKHTS